LVKKIGMTSVFGNDGELIPVTVIQAGPCKIVSIRTNDKTVMRLSAWLWGEERKEYYKPVLGQFKKNNLNACSILKEFKFPNSQK
jgi:large subunit ribosomal protein L3